jgi:hypothetical protein
VKPDYAEDFRMYRQGDVLLIPVESIPVKLKDMGRDGGRVVLAHGEATGHTHAIADERAALFRKVDGEAAVFMRVLGEAPVALVHDEHDTIMIPPGWYRVIRQREYSPGAIRNVED